MDATEVEKEIKRGYNAFKIYEKALEAIEGYKVLQSQIVSLKTEADALGKNLIVKKDEYEKQIIELGDFYSKKIEALKTDNENTLANFIASQKQEKDSLKKEIASLKKTAETLSADLKKSNDNLASVDREIQNKTELLGELNKKIEVVKSEVSSLFGGK